jgi:predicted SprT family Zn-dependent metalloprotease
VEAVLKTLPLSPRALQTAALASELLSAHGLHTWSFRFNRSKVKMGLCKYGPRTIELSTYFVEHNPYEAIHDTLLHEGAHALVGPGHGHDAVWEAMCLRVGAKPERLSFEAAMPAGRWRATCGGCGMVHHKHRRPKRMVGWWCSRCGPERGRLAWGLATGSDRRAKAQPEQAEGVA